MERTPAFSIAAVDENSDDSWSGIAEMASLSALSTDTLRWYEKEGIVPRVERGPDGRRRYGGRNRDLVLLLAVLRSTGMATSAMKKFVGLVAEGAASHGRRITLLTETRDLLDQRRRALDTARTAVDAKIAHYEQLILAGLDCDGAPVTEPIQHRQRSRNLTLPKDIP